MSFLHTGREEPLRGGRDEEEQDGAWDVFADFNNAGPRYSSAFQHDENYQNFPKPILKPEEDAETVPGPVEMVTVPGMGPEWQRSELRDMTKAGKREKKTESRRQKWKQWIRDERGLCGSWFKRKVLVYFLFALCVVVSIILAVAIPRVPSISLNERQPLFNATGAFNKSIPVVFSRAPANFSFPAFSTLQVDTTGNYLPLTFNSISAQVFDLGSNRQIGTGYLGHTRLPAKGYPVIQVPLNFSYVANNDTDPTWLEWYNGCRNAGLYIGGVRPGVSFGLVLDLDIFGLPTQHSVSTQISDTNCPVELPINSI
jgi:hypothetical protein